MAPNLLSAADHVAAVASAPTAEPVGKMLPELYGRTIGGLPGWDVISAQAHLIDVPELRWPISNKTYESMRRDSQIQGLLTSVFLPIRHMECYVNPADSPDGCAEEIAEDLGLPLMGDPPVADGVGIDFDDHLRLALLALVFGHQFFEEAGDIVGEGAAMRYRLRTLMQYPQSTIARINIHANGDLRSLQQNTVPEWPEVDADRLLPYVWDREAANWAGRPLLIGIYKNWLAKDALVRSDVVVHRRFSGIPVAKTVDASVGSAAQREGARMAQAVQAGDGAGLSTPFGMELELLGVKGTLPDAIASIRYHDEQMARAFMQMFAELGKTQSGSRALGTTLMDHYALGVLAVAKWVRKSLMVLVRRIVDRNYGPGASCPQIEFRQDDHEDITITDLVAAIDAGLITVDDDLEAQIRDRANLVARNAAQQGRVPPTQAPPAPAPGDTPAPVAAATRPPSHRPPRAAAATSDPQPPDHIANAGVNFAALQATFLAATSRLRRQWADITAAQIDELVAQVEAATTAADLAAIAATPAGTDVLLTELEQVLADGAQSALDEAAHQGATLAVPELTIAQAAIAQHAEATAQLLAQSLTLSAASKALSIDSASIAPAELAAQVRDHLDTLAGQTLDYELAGAVTRAQNEGRFTAMDGAPDGTTYYASELNDTHTCEFCAAVDDSEYASMAEARRDYGAGHYVGCLGGNRCRGTVVAVYAES